MRLIKKKFCSGDRSEARHTLKREEFFAHTATSAVLRNPNLIISSLSIHILSLQKSLLFQIISLITSPRKTSHMFSRLVRTKHLDIKVYQQAAGTMILLAYVGSIEWSNRLHKCNEEYEGRNRHNVECFLWRCTTFRLAKPAFFRYSVNFTSDVFYVAYYRKYVKLFDSVNWR